MTRTQEERNPVTRDGNHRADIEARVISGCLKSDEVFAETRRRLSVKDFEDKKHQIVWVCLCNWPSGCDTAALIDSVHYGIATLHKQQTGDFLHYDDFALWFDALLDANPAPRSTTKAYVERLLELSLKLSGLPANLSCTEWA